MTEEEKNCLKFLEEKLIPKKLHVNALGMLNTYGLEANEIVKQNANYKLHSDILYLYEEEYQDLLNKMAVKLKEELNK